MNENIKLLQLGDLASYINGRGFKPSELTTKGLPVIRIANLNNKDAPYDFFNGSLDDAHLINTNDILVSWSASLDTYVWERESAALNQHIFKVVPDLDKVDKEYLFFVLKFAMIGLREIVHGATMKHVTRPEFEGFKIAVVICKDKQHQIAVKLKSQLAEVETARKALEEQLSDVNLFVSRLKDQLLSTLQSVGRVELGELIIGIEAGKSFKTLERLASDTELAVLKVSAVSWTKFNPHEAKAISNDYKPDDKHKVYKGDLIISRANTIELVGAVVRVDADYPNCLLSDKTLRLVCNEEQILPDYLLYALRWPEARLHIEANATGSSDSMRNISQKTIRTIPIPLPDKKTQQEIVDREKAIAFHLEKVTHAHKQAINDLNILPNKLLAQAFKGLTE
ncbi:MAG: restriction endonuclease subunit S [Methylococcaceae bacterium]|nr:restriction endonuclease subunit S [Methylococcaceae bacterium]